MNLNKLVLASLCCLAVSSCIRSPVAMMPSTEPFAPGSYSKLGPVAESDCIWHILGIPVTSANDLQDAIRDAIIQKGADGLVQVTAETNYMEFGLFNRICTIVQGVAVRVNTVTK